MTPLLLAFIGSVLLSAQTPSPYMPLVGALVAGMLLLRKGRLSTWSRNVRCAGCGVFVGLLWSALYGLDHTASRLPEACVGVPATLTGEVISLPKVGTTARGERRQVFFLSVESLAPDSCVGPHKIYLSFYGDRDIAPGERLQFDVKLKRPWGMANPGSSSFQAWYAQEGIDAVGSSSRVRGTGQFNAGKSFLAGINRLRYAMAGAISRQSIPTDTSAALRALTVGDKSAISNDLWQTFRILGVTHLMVISGLHIGMVGGLGYALGSLLSRLPGVRDNSGRLITAVAAMIPATLYSAMAGFELPTQRALCMLAVFLTCDFFARPVSGWSRLLVACAFVLTVNPLASLGSGFWLSFCAVAVLLWLAQWRRRGLSRFRSALLTHGFMALAMVPAGAWFFGGGSLISALANLILIPLIGFVVVPLALIAITLQMIESSYATLLWQLAGLPLSALLSTAHGVVQLAGRQAFLPISAGLFATALCLTGIAVWSIPLRWIGKILALILMLPMLLGTAADRRWNEGGVLTVLDVGQGTALVYRQGRRVLVYDTGGGDPAGNNAAASILVPYLRSLGVRQLDTLVVSHGDTDHSAGWGTLLDAFPAARIRSGAELSRDMGGKACRAGESWRWPSGSRFRFLSPAREQGLSSNNGSCVLQIVAGGQRFLLPGDIDKSRERELVRYWRQDIRSDWLLVPHHGSGTSSSHVLLKSVQASRAAISAGKANSFGHPRSDVLSRLHYYNTWSGNTAQAGALEYRVLHNGEAEASAFRHPFLPFWMR